MSKGSKTTDCRVRLCADTGTNNNDNNENVVFHKIINKVDTVMNFTRPLANFYKKKLLLSFFSQKNFKLSNKKIIILCVLDSWSAREGGGDGGRVGRVADSAGPAAALDCFLSPFSRECVYALSIICYSRTATHTTHLQ